MKYENHEWTQTYDTLDEAVEYATTRVGEELGAMTVTLLRDVTLEQPLCVDTCYIDVILELDGHTISGALDEALFQVSYLYGTEVFAIQNGTIQNSGSGAALLLDNGKTTVQNVNVIGDTELTARLVSSTNYVPTFIGGGTFTQIRRSSDNYNLTVSDILGKGCYFVDPDGTRVSDQDRLQNVTVMSCQHKDENGKFTYVKGDNKGNYICTICGNLCPHEHRSDNVCQDCGLLIGVVREKREPQYFDSFDHAWTQDWSMKYTLVRDQETNTVLWNNSMTIDLNGCTFVQSTEGAGKGSTSISDGVTTVQNSAAKAGHYQGEVVVGGLREGDGKLVIPAQNNNLTIDKLTVTTGRAELAGGTFGTITVADNKVCKDLLAAGYYYEKDGKPTGYGDETTLTQVTVKPCDHQSQMVMVGTDCMCPCGNVHFVAQVERAGVSTYYADFAAACAAVNVYFEITLKNDNYCFNDGNRTSSYLFGGKIIQAAAPTAKAGTLTIQNDCKADYTFDFKSLLPALATSKSYGTIEYQLDQVSLDGYYGSGATISDGVLYLPVKAYTGDTTGVVGTVTVTVITQNYENITLTLKIRASEKKLAVADGDVTVAQSTVTYGDLLHDIEIAGTMKDGSKTVKGTFVWQVSQQKLNAGTHQVGWKFVPDDTDAYLEVHGTVEVTVNKATPAGEYTG